MCGCAEAEFAAYGNTFFIRYHKHVNGFAAVAVNINQRVIADGTFVSKIAQKVLCLVNIIA